MAGNRAGISTETFKKELLIALELSLGIVTTACKSVGVAQKTFYQYKNQDSEFRKKVEAIEEIKIDFVEGKLLKIIGDDNPAGIIFFLKTKAKHRGYAEHVNIVHNTDTGVLVTPPVLSLQDWAKISQENKEDFERKKEEFNKS